MAGRRMGHNLKLINRNTAPASPEAGDMWYRSDLGQIRASDGSAAVEQLTIGPTGNVPTVRSAAWHNVPAYGNAGSANVPDGRLFAMPFWPGRLCSITGVAANVTLALVTANLRMGIYLSDGVLPTTLLADFGTVATGVLGTAQINGLNTRVRPVLHYLVCGRQGGLLVNLGVSTRSTWDPIIANTSPVIAANRNAYYIDGVGGALPASFGAPAGSDQGVALSVQLT
jgi:hypothetical protein